MDVGKSELHLIVIHTGTIRRIETWTFRYNMCDGKVPDIEDRNDLLEELGNLIVCGLSPFTNRSVWLLNI